ncbi:MAG: PepSY-associated TM helix domain-containing protein [Terracidiphilus sp.]
MPFLKNLIHSPRKLLLRTVFFQIHLWAGIFLSAYVAVIAVSGAILVFEDELTADTLPPGLTRYDPAHAATIPEVMRSFNRAYPGDRVANLNTPSSIVPAYQISAIDAQGREFALVADPSTAVLLNRPRNWVNWMHDLHLYLLLGAVDGLRVNGIGAAILLLLTITGLGLWWQGLKNWTRGLRISLRSHWRRINYDAHYAIGFWTLAIVFWWSLSGIYFAWYRQVGFIVNAFSPLRGMVQPALPVLPAAGARRASLDSILAAAQAASPRGRLFGISDSSLSGPTVFVQMDLRAPGDFSHRDLITLDAANAHVLAIWHYGRNQTAGDWIMWSMHPLHFGTLWGLGFKILWFLLGLSLAVLSVTGLIMYWNRYLRHRLHAVQRREAKKSLQQI